MNRDERRKQGRDVKRQVAALKKQGAVDLKAPMPQPVKTISLGYCWNEGRGVSGFWHQSILRLLQGLAGKVGFRPVGVESGPFLTKARNLIVDRFLATEDDYLLFTDTDMMFGAEDVKLLLDADQPIAGALYYNAATGEAPWATALVEDEGDPDTPGAKKAYVPLVLPELPEPPVPPGPGTESEEPSPEAAAEYGAELATWEASAAEATKPQVVAAVGLGLTLIKREVVAAVKTIYNRPFEFVDDAGEDLTFCLRAKEMGFDTVVVPQARIGHLKATVL